MLDLLPAWPITKSGHEGGTTPPGVLPVSGGPLDATNQYQPIVSTGGGFESCFAASDRWLVRRRLRLDVKRLCSIRCFSPQTAGDPWLPRSGGRALKCSGPIARIVGGSLPDVHPLMILLANAPRVSQPGVTVIATLGPFERTTRRGPGIEKLNWTLDVWAHLRPRALSVCCIANIDKEFTRMTAAAKYFP